MATAEISVTETPSHRPSRVDTARNRMSFVGGRKAAIASINGTGPPVTFQLGNGIGNARTSIDDAGHSRSTSSSGRSQSKDRSKRRSWFGGASKDKDTHSAKGDVDATADGDWVTDYGQDSIGRARGRTMASQESVATSSGGYAVKQPPLERRDTSTSVSASVSSKATGLGGSVSGSVRKRLSMLKLGKKTSKVSVVVDSVAEE